MQKLMVSLKNCHGIHLLESDLDFGKSRSTAIYAPNGTMKTSFAHTFREFAAGEDSGDQVFPDRRTERSITDEARNPIDPSDDVKRFSQELCEYRNMVHAAGELKDGHHPDGYTFAICREVVVAALNDLSRISSPSAPAA
jgi:hypothetical protein